jgi:hypothetical protein
LFIRDITAASAVAGELWVKTVTNDEIIGRIGGPLGVVLNSSK